MAVKRPETAHFRVLASGSINTLPTAEKRQDGPFLREFMTICNIYPERDATRQDRTAERLLRPPGRDARPAGRLAGLLLRLRLERAHVRRSGRVGRLTSRRKTDQFFAENLFFFIGCDYERGEISYKTAESCESRDGFV